MRKSVFAASAFVVILGATVSVGFAKETMTKLADAHTDACVYNYTNA